MQLTSEQIADLWQEVIADPEHDCSCFGHWFQSQIAERESNDQVIMELLGELEVRRRRVLVNLALRRYGRHD